MWQAPSHAQELCNRLPAPIASSYFAFSFRNLSPSPHERASHVEILFDSIFRYLAAVCISTCRDEPVRDGRIGAALAELSNPSLGSWNKLIAEILSFHATSNSTAFPIPELLESMRTKIDNTAMAEAIKRIPGIAKRDYQPEKPADVLRFTRFFVWYRNKVAHERLNSIPSILDKILKLLEPALDEFVVRLRSLADYPPLAFIHWSGPHMLCDVLQGSGAHFCQVLIESNSVANPAPGDVFLCHAPAKGEPEFLARLSPVARRVDCSDCDASRLVFINRLDTQRKSAEYVSCHCTHPFHRQIPEHCLCEYFWLPTAVPANGRPASSVPHAADGSRNAIEDPVPLVMSFRVLVDVFDPRNSAYITRSAVDGETLFDGDGFQISVELNQDAFFCLLFVSSDGMCRVEFPPDGDVKGGCYLAGNVQNQFPRNGEFYVLDENPGAEHLWLIASHDSLDDFLNALADRQAVDSVSAQWIRNSDLVRLSQTEVDGGRQMFAPDRTSGRLIETSDLVVRAIAGSRSVVHEFTIEHRESFGGNRLSTDDTNR